MMYPSTMVAHMLLIFVSVVNAKTIHSVDQRHVGWSGSRLGCTETDTYGSRFYGCDSDNQGYIRQYGPSDPPCTGDYSDVALLGGSYCDSGAKGDSYNIYRQFRYAYNCSDIESYDETVMQTCIDRDSKSYIVYCMLNEGLPFKFRKEFLGDNRQEACRAEEYPTTLPDGGEPQLLLNVCTGGYGEHVRNQLGGKDTYCHEPAVAYCAFLADYGIGEGSKIGDCKDACAEWEQDCIDETGDIDYCEETANKNCRDKCKAYIKDRSICD